MNNTGILRLANGFLNTVNDPVVGQSVTGGQSYGGQLGAVMELNNAQAVKMFKASVGNGYAGKYQYVQFKAGTTAANVVGGPVYWDDIANFVVTPDVPTGVPGFAGISLSVVTKGNYGFILVDGFGDCHALANTTKGTPAIGDNLVLSTAGFFDDLADATAFDGTNLKLAVGQWLVAPADASGGGLYKAYVRGQYNAGN